MQLSKLSLRNITIFLFVISIAGCSDAFQAEDGEDTFLVSGQVLNEADSQPLVNAFVEITNPTELQQSTTTDSVGRYSFSIQANQSVSLDIKASKANFDPVTQNLNVSPGENFEGVDLVLSSTADGGEGNDDDDVEGEPEGAAAIVLTSNPRQAINIKETGDVVSSPFTFQVQDSAGRSLNTAKAVEVEFRLINSPGGEEEVIPKRATTNSEGEVTTTLFSGNEAGPVKLQAIIERPEDGLVIKSSPVLVAIHGGFPDEDHFSIGIDKFNFEGYTINNLRNNVSVVVGDKFSNPVKPGTVVYFETTGGVIQGSGPTDEDGVVEVELISGDPRPTDDIPGSGSRPGYATITARTVDENDNSITKQANVVFSTSRAIISATPESFDLPPNGGASFDYEVTDLNGNPMAAGTQISIDAGEGIEISGDANFTLGNNLFPGPGATEFSFSIRDTDDETNDEAELTLQITVTAPSGETTTYSGIQGIRHDSPKGNAGDVIKH